MVQWFFLVLVFFSCTYMYIPHHFCCKHHVTMIQDQGRCQWCFPHDFGIEVPTYWAVTGKRAHFVRKIDRYHVGTKMCCIRMWEAYTPGGSSIREGMEKQGKKSRQENSCSWKLGKHLNQSMRMDNKKNMQQQCQASQIENNSCSMTTPIPCN